MTHPTIYDMAFRLSNTERESWIKWPQEDKYFFISQAKSAARALLTAEPSEAEIEAAALQIAQRTNWARVPDTVKHEWLQIAYTAIKAARAALMKEMGI